MIYVIWCEGTSYLKIGFTDDESAESRLASLQVGCPFSLELIATIPGTMQFEGTLHGILKKLHVRGEWFDISKFSALDAARERYLLNVVKRATMLDGVQSFLAHMIASCPSIIDAVVDLKVRSITADLATRKTANRQIKKATSISEHSLYEWSNLIRHWIEKYPGISKSEMFDLLCSHDNSIRKRRGTDNLAWIEFKRLCDELEDSIKSCSRAAALDA